jgi:hypothetical protein
LTKIDVTSLSANRKEKAGTVKKIKINCKVPAERVDQWTWYAHGP